jgi:hypothetical protein
VSLIAGGDAYLAYALPLQYPANAQSFPLLALDLLFHMLRLSVFAGQQQTCAASVCFRYDPDFRAVAKRVTAQNSESILQAEFVFLAVVFIQIAPIPVYMPGEQRSRGNPGLLQCS